MNIDKTLSKIVTLTQPNPYTPLSFTFHPDPFYPQPLLMKIMDSRLLMSQAYYVKCIIIGKEEYKRYFFFEKVISHH